MSDRFDRGWNKKAPPLQGRDRSGRNASQAFLNHAGGMVHPIDGWGLSVERLHWLQQRAAEMRRNSTEPEKRLWRHLSNSQLSDCKFRRQSVVGPFIADFLCPQRALIVEVDGDTHDEAKDRLRDDWLAEHGYRVVRVTNFEVMSNMDGVAHVIASALSDAPGRWHSPHPNPSPEGEGLAGVEVAP